MYSTRYTLVGILFFYINFSILWITKAPIYFIYTSCVQLVVLQNLLNSVSILPTILIMPVVSSLRHLPKIVYASISSYP